MAQRGKEAKTESGHTFLRFYHVPDFSQAMVMWPPISASLIISLNRHEQTCPIPAKGFVQQKRVKTKQEQSYAHSQLQVIVLSKADI